MAGRVDQATQIAAIARITELGASIPAIRDEVARVLTGSAFHSSKRSQRFLAFIVDQSLSGNFDCLKERSIGVQLFERPATYDTNEDSIVRVTATDVRKRLAEHYAAAPGSAVRIELPSGSYIPEFHILPVAAAAASVQPLSAPVRILPAERPVEARRSWLWVAGVLVGVLLVASVGMVRSSQNRVKAFPWSEVFSDSRRTYVVVSDTSAAALQDLLGIRIRLSDYANRTYLPDAATLAPETARAVQLLQRNLFTAAADVSVTSRLAQKASLWGNSLTVRSAKAMQIREFQTDDNFILIGSQRANPWVELIAGRLGFAIEYDETQKRQICRDRKQLKEHVPTAITGGSGEAYAMVALVRNPGRAGHVLLIAGTNMEGTEAAGEFVAQSFEAALSKAGVTGTEFEALLKLSSMAGAASSVEVVALRPVR